MSNLIITRQLVSRIFSTGQKYFYSPSIIPNRKLLVCTFRGGRTRFLSTQVEADITDNNVNVVPEKPIGPSEKLQFQAETRVLLDIVAKSLYSNKEVFVRELISNASDALEKLRYVHLSDGSETDIGSLEIHITSDKQNRILTIQDNGIGMTKDELISNLGTIAKSGTKAFLEDLKNKSSDISSFIGQFGVGFYSSFMVANKVEVYTKSLTSESPGYCWISDGSGSYEIQEAENVARGTKIVLHLKPDCREFCDNDVLDRVIKKYSNFVISPIYLNGDKTNLIQPLWLMDPKEITKEQHKEFYNFVSNSYDNPRFIMHYKTDAPLSIRALLYFPDTPPPVYNLEMDCEVALYARRVLIKTKTNEILPKWCRFVKGVVDSEDIPLNLSRELLQNSSLISKLRAVLSSRIIKFLSEKSQKEPEEYAKFFDDYGLYIKGGIVFSSTTEEKEDVAKLLRYESSATKRGETVSLGEYCKRMQPEQKDIFYLSTSNRLTAESSPYYELLKKKNIEVLYLYQSYDEQILINLDKFNDNRLVSAEKYVRDAKSDSTETLDLGSDQKNELDSLISWAQDQLKDQAYSVTLTSNLDDHPCIVTVENVAMARQYMKQFSGNLDDKMRYTLLKPQLELNPKHPIIKKLVSLSKSNPELSSMIIKQLFVNSMLIAGLMEDTRFSLTDFNKLLTLTLEKH